MDEILNPIMLVDRVQLLDRAFQSAGVQPGRGEDWAEAETACMSNVILIINYLIHFLVL